MSNKRDYYDILGVERYIRLTIAHIKIVQYNRQVYITHGSTAVPETAASVSTASLRHPLSYNRGFQAYRIILEEEEDCEVWRQLFLSKLAAFCFYLAFVEHGTSAFDRLFTDTGSDFVYCRVIIPRE